MEKNKILIVEDNIDLIESYEIVFKKEWYNVEIAYDWKEAGRKLKSFKPYVVLLDIMMPNTNGFSFLEKVRKTGNNVIIILNSNLSQDSDIERWLSLWANKYLRKSDFNPFELVDEVEKVIK